MIIDKVLEDDLKWREAELSSLKRLVITSPKNSTTSQSLLRALWAMLYAHFEGFTKYCWDTLFDYIQSENIPRSQLDEKFSLISLEPDFKSLRGNLSSKNILDFYLGAMPTALSKPAHFPDGMRLTTESNLWPNIFERETLRIGISCAEVETHRQRLKTLVARRNDIAHGKSMTISTINEYGDYEHAAICLMHELALKILDTAEHKLYLRPEYRV